MDVSIGFRRPTSPSRRVWRWALGIVLAAACVLSTGCASGSRRGRTSFEPRPAPEFAAVDASGNPVASTDFSGRVLVIDFWATWCGPCRASMPNMHAIERRFASDPGVAFLAVHTDETGDPAGYFAQNGYEMRLVPRGRAVARAFDVYSLPTYVVIDRQGMVVYRHESQLTDSVRDRMIREIQAARAE